MRIHTDISGLAALGCLHCPMAGGLSYFTRHAGHLFAFLLILSQCFSRSCIPATMWMSCGCRRLLGCEMPHIVCLSPVGYSTESQDNVRVCTRPPPLALRHHPCRQGSDVSGTTLGYMDRSLVGREAGTTRCSPAADVPRFRASKPPFVPRHTAFPKRLWPWGP